MEIVAGHTCTHIERAALAGALITEFGRQYPAWTHAEAVEEIAASGPLPLTLVARDASGVLGCASLLADDEVSDWDDVVWLGNVVVLEHARNRGVGSQLVASIEAHAASLGLQQIHLVTTTAIRWYESRNWSVIGEGSVHGHAMTVMHKSL